jgi:PEP-CTERM motif
MAKSIGFSLKTVLAASGILFCLAAGSAMAGTVTTSTVSLPNGSTTININDSAQSVDGGGSNIITGTIGLQTNIGALSTYCVDLFDYINTGNPSVNTFNQNPLAAGETFQNGTATGSFTQAQVNTITRLLTNGSLQTQNVVNTAALQIAIWAAEYDTAAANGSYNITSGDSFYFSATGDSNSAATLAQAQTYLNDATGYQNGGSFVSATWLTNSTHFVEFLTSTTGNVQDLVYLATPEPSTVAIFGMGLIGLWAVRRRKMI